MAEQPEKKEQKIACICCGGAFLVPQQKDEMKEGFPLFRVYRIEEDRSVTVRAVYMCVECQKKHNAIPRILFQEAIWLKIKDAPNTFAIEMLKLPPYGGKKIV
jgi:hypothetical protein